MSYSYPNHMVVADTRSATPVASFPLGRLGSLHFKSSAGSEVALREEEYVQGVNLRARASPMHMAVLSR